MLANVAITFGRNALTRANEFSQLPLFGNGARVRSYVCD
jgi:hypothetical protein